VGVLDVSVVAAAMLIVGLSTTNAKGDSLTFAAQSHTHAASRTSEIENPKASLRILFSC
jgi:hypothetical protein